MGKRSNFERVERDYYVTPKEAVLPLIPHLIGFNTFVEPCAGNGALINHIEQLTNHKWKCVESYDIEPKANNIIQKNALEIKNFNINTKYIITNPPWDRKILHPMIEHFSNLLPTWLLFDADWMHTKQSLTLMNRCVSIVSIGRVKWIPDSKMTGKDNCCWYLFDKPRKENEEIKFYGRT